MQLTDALQLLRLCKATFTRLDLGYLLLLLLLGVIGQAPTQWLGHGHLLGQVVAGWLIVHSILADIYDGLLALPDCFTLSSSLAQTATLVGGPRVQVGNPVLQALLGVCALSEGEAVVALGLVALAERVASSCNQGLVVQCWLWTIDNLITRCRCLLPLIQRRRCRLPPVLIRISRPFPLIIDIFSWFLPWLLYILLCSQIHLILFLCVIIALFYTNCCRLLILLVYRIGYHHRLLHRMIFINKVDLLALNVCFRYLFQIVRIQNLGWFLVQLAVVIMLFRVVR